MIVIPPDYGWKSLLFPYVEFIENGFAVTVASPNGGKTPIDPRSVAQETPSAWQPATAVLENTVKLADVNDKEFAAVILPGGHGPMFDLAGDALLAAVLRRAAEADKVIGAVCHGPAGLVKATLADGQPLVAGKKVTGFSNSEEKMVQLDALVPFLLEDRLRELGAEYSNGDAWTEYVVVDRKLVTGQNPQSSAAFARAVTKLLQK